MASRGESLTTYSWPDWGYQRWRTYKGVVETVGEQALRGMVAHGKVILGRERRASILAGYVQPGLPPYRDSVEVDRQIVIVCAQGAYER